MLKEFLSRPGFAPFFVRDFLLFFLTRFQAALAIQMINVAVGWLVYDMTGSALALGFVGLSIFLPNVLFILAAGHVADRYERRRVLIICNLVLVIATLGRTGSSSRRIFRDSRSRTGSEERSARLFPWRRAMI